MKKTLIMVAILMMATMVWGQAILVEDFNYPVGSLLTNNGWTAHSGAGSQPIDVTSGLSFAGYLGSGIGGAANLDNTGEDVHRTFTQQTSGTVYAAFVIQTSSSNSAGYFLHFGQATIGTTFFTRVWVNATGNGVGIGTNAPVTYVPITANTPTLLVIKHDISSKISSLYVFNSFPSSEPGTADATFEETASFTNVGSIALRQYNAAQRVIVDGIRVATNWADAVAASGGGNLPPSISNIIQTPATDITSSDVVAVTADVTDSDGTVTLVQLKWGTSTGVYPNTIAMSLSSGITYETDTEIPVQADETTVYYVVYAKDDDNDSTTSSERSYTVHDPVVASIPYTQNFSGFVSAETIPDGWAVSNNVYNGDWGTGLSAGLRGNANVLGFQHTSTTGIFTATLSLINTTGNVIQELYVSYLGMVERVAEGRSPEWTVTFNDTEVPGLFYSTSAGVNETKSVLLTGLNIANNQSVTIVWSSDRGLPTGASKQIGIGNVYVSTDSPSEQVQTPTFNPPAGDYTTTQSVAITSATSMVTIYYSYDSASGPWTIYNMLSPLSISETKTVWAYATKSGMTDSNVAAATYTFPASATLPYEELFVANLGDCYSYSVSGATKEWYWFSGGYAAMNGYNSGDTEEDWLILPAINFNTYENVGMTFDTWYNYGTDDTNNYLKLLYSQDYSGLGNPSSSTWTEISFTKPASSSVWTSSGILNLSAITGNSVYLAYKYRYEAGSYRLWQVDNINIYEGLDYYSSVNGLTGSALWQGLQSIITSGHVTNTEVTAKSSVYTVLDNHEGMVQCIYTGDWAAPGTAPYYTPTGFSIEHSYAQSWYNASGDNISEQAWADWDLHHLFPARLDANSERSNYPFDYITGIFSTWGSGSFYSYFGGNAFTITAFEVADENKGNIARALLYFTVRYYDVDTGLSRFGVDMLPVLYQWHNQDPVDTNELARNEAIYGIQANRNPFVDHPEFVEAIWGNMLLATPVNLSATTIGETSFTANWDAVSRAIEYRLDVSTDPTFLSYGGFVSIYKNYTVSGTSQAIEFLTTGITYYFRVKAVDSIDGTLSMNSASGSATTTAPVEGYLVNFEGETEVKTAYASGTVSLSGLDWNMTEALIGTSASDWKNGIRSARMRGYGTSIMTMLNDKTDGIGTISFYYRRYGTDAQVDWKVEYSTNDGVDWTQIGTDFTAPATDDVQLFSEQVNVAGNIRVRIKRATETGITNQRLNIDDILLTDYSGSGQLDIPQIVSVNVSGGNITITWDAVFDAVSYRVEESDTPTGTFTEAAGTFNGTQWVSATSGTKKFYRVIAE
jgi:hypothetical protein